MSNIFSKYRQYIIANQTGIVTEASNSFCNLTECSQKELIGNTVETVFLGLLRLDPAYPLENPEAETFLFTKSLQALFVHIEKSNYGSEGDVIYYTYEIPNSRFEDKNLYIEQLISENKLSVGVYSPDFILLRANQCYLDLLSQPYHEKALAMGKHARELIRNFEGSMLENSWKACIRDKQTVYVRENHVINSGNGFGYWDKSFTPIVENGRVTYLVSILQDVTERVLRLEIIQEQKAQYQTVLENMSDGLICIDRDFHIVHANKYVRDLVKKYNINLFTEKYYDVNGAEITKNDQLVHKVFNGIEVNNERLMIRKNNEKLYYECNGSFIRDHHGEVELGIFNFRNITKIVENEYKIQSQAEELDALLDNMAEGLVIADTNDFVQKLNLAALRILGLESFKIMTYKSFSQKYIVTDLEGNVLPAEKWPLARVLAKEEFSNLELWLHYKEADKDPCLCSFSGTPVYNENGEIILFFVTLTDITEQRVIQEKLFSTIKEKNEILSESMAFKDEFLYLITHEMKTPLAVISSALQAMDLVCREMPDKAAKYIKTIRQNTNRQLRLVGSLLDIFKINSGTITLNNDCFDIVGLTELIVRSIQPIAMQKCVRVNFFSDIKTKIIFIDEEKVERILLNLLSNALKFTPEHKQINVKLYTKKIQQKNMICISICDEGIGIPKDKQSVIFERFGQVNTNRSKPEEGTGLGLYLVKLLLDAMGGAITLESEEEKGSNFTVMLPIYKHILKDAHPAKQEPEPTASDSRLIHELAIQFSDIYF